MHLLVDAWRRTAPGEAFTDWLQQSRKLIVHSGGQSRRLPAYAATGKALMPIPVVRGSIGQRPDQALVDLLVPAWERLLQKASETSRVAVTSGDALVQFTSLPKSLPAADVVCIGIEGSPEDGKHFGVFYSTHSRPDELDFFLQKPVPAETRSLAGTHGFLLDTGVWLLSEKAVRRLMARCGWDDAKGAFRGGVPSPYELYSAFGLSLGAHPKDLDGEGRGLTCKVVAAEGSFYHFGTTRQMIEAVSRLHNQSHRSGSLGFLTVARRHPDQHIQNTVFDGPHPFGPDAKVWIENSHIGENWQLEGDNVVTGAPTNDWHLELPKGACLDFVPVGESAYCVRAYGFDDAFRGAVSDPATTYLGIPFNALMAGRGLAPADLGIAAECDIQDAAIFPVMEPGALTGDLLNAIVSGGAEAAKALRTWLPAARRLSAQQLLAEVNLQRLYEQRLSNQRVGLVRMLENHAGSVFYHVDLEVAAHILRPVEIPAEARELPEGSSPVKQMHHSMFKAVWRRERGDKGWESDAAQAFGHLRNCLADEDRLPGVCPRLDVQEDQIVWARAPLRLDLAGGWSDTPPYCLLHGGKVLNVAVDLNGQPPVQVFARLSEKPELVLRSIDLGTEQTVRTYEELLATQDAAQEFSLARIALALAGFAPRFSAGPRHATLKDRLEAFGGGIELSLVAAVPKGSGLGTSSILASTVLGALSDFCGLGWSQNEIFGRTLALEQLLGTGGGWQDQAGGCLHGLKVLETGPGLDQRPTCRWLPDRLLGPEYANRRTLLFYTGITRMARSVLGEIVRGMFLNSGRRLRVIEDIVANVQPLMDSIQQEDPTTFGAGIRTSWELNQALDSGTNPPAVAALMADVEDYVDGAKLLGAGGGGYLFMVAKDEEAAQRIRQTLSSGRHSPKARFVDFAVSQVGLEVTRS